MENTVYLFDKATKLPCGTATRQLCQRTGEYLTPVNSLNAAPPKYSDCVVVKAVNGAWVADLAASKDKAKSAVHALHAETLRMLTGGATPEERDTWAPKAAGAAALLDGTATQSQIAMIASEAAQMSISPEALAAIIVEKASRFEALAGRTAAFRAMALAEIDATTSVDDLDKVFLTLREKMTACVLQLVTNK